MGQEVAGSLMAGMGEKRTLGQAVAERVYLAQANVEADIDDAATAVEDAGGVLTPSNPLPSGLLTSDIQTEYLSAFAVIVASVSFEGIGFLR